MKEQQPEITDPKATISDPGQLTEAQLSEGLNTDENRAGIDGLEDRMSENEDSRLENELIAAKDKYLRLAAEFENYKRRTSRERIELIQTAGKDIIQSLLEVLDDSERAEKNLEKSEDLNQIKEGIQLVFNKLRATLQTKGLRAMEAHGEMFDPEVHEAITEIPAGNEAMAGKVMDVVTPGYYLNDKLIRHAKVVVGK